MVHDEPINLYIGMFRRRFGFSFGKIEVFVDLWEYINFKFKYLFGF